MVQKNELRVGNILINPLKDGLVYTIKNGEDIDKADMGDQKDLSFNLKAYVLNADRLKKCGFINGNLEIPDLNISIVSIDHGDYLSEIMLKDENGNQISKAYEFLHQLQNLYFAVTGKELSHSIIKHHD